MSYSFTVREADKFSAALSVQNELAKVIEQQEIHKKDCGQAFAAAHAFISLLDDDPESDVVVTVSGSLSWDAPSMKIRWASVNVSACLRKKGQE
jgi:hypothetical protein